MALETPEMNPFGPYVADEGGTVEFTIIVKAAPERSQTYGETVCTAGILDDGRLVRVYPVKWDVYASGRLPRWTRATAKLVPSDERAKRPESHKLDGEMRELPSPLVDKLNTPWTQRSALISKGVNGGGIQALRDLQEQYGTSLGIVKVKDLMNFRITAPLDEIIEQADFRTSKQKTLTGEAKTEGFRIDKIKHVFRYQWRCDGSCCRPGGSKRGYHDTTCEDWELFEAFRKWRQTYESDVELLGALKNKFYDCMGETDLHFMMGTPSDPKAQKSWMIIGLFYPNIHLRPDSSRRTLCSTKYKPDELLKIDRSFDTVAEGRGESEPKTAEGRGLDRFFKDD